MIGQGISRTDGPIKVTGRAAYSAERQEAGPTLHGFILGAGIGKGRIARIDIAAAEPTIAEISITGIAMAISTAPSGHGCALT